MADMGMLSFQTPEEVAAARRAAEDARNIQMSQMGLGQSARYGMLSAGSALGNAVGAATGYVDPNEARAQKTQQVMSSPDSDLNTSKGMLAKAAELRTIDPRLSMQLLLKGRELEKQEQAAAIASRKEDRADKELKDVKIAGVANKLQMDKDRLAANIARWAADANNDALSIEQRREAVKLINQNRLELERLDNEAALAGIRLKESYGTNATPGKIDLSKMKDSDKWKIVKEQGADKAAIGNASAQSADVVSLATKLLNHPGLPSITGWNSLTNIAALPSGDAKAALTILESLKSKAATVGRALASETGKLGNMAMGEWKIVAEDIANLDPSSKEFPDQVQRIVKKTQEMETRLRQNYDETYSIYEGLNPALSASTLPPQAPRMDGTPNPTQPTRPSPRGNSFSGVTNPTQVKQMFQSGKITREQAKSILADMDARGVK